LQIVDTRNLFTNVCIKYIFSSMSSGLSWSILEWNNQSTWWSTHITAFEFHLINWLIPMLLWEVWSLIVMVFLIGWSVYDKFAYILFSLPQQHYMRSGFSGTWCAYVDIILVRKARFWYNLHQVRSKSNNWKVKWLKIH
jgi:hypothetical protein